MARSVGGGHRSRGVLALVALLTVVDVVLLFSLRNGNGLPAEGGSSLAGEATAQQNHATPPHAGSPPRPPRVDALRSPRSGGNVETIISLTFDDALSDQYELARLLPPRRLTATVYTNSGMLIDEGYLGRMSLAQLHELADAGVEIGGHTVNHPDLTELSVPDARREICDDRRQLRAWGFQVVSFAYPSSRTNAEVERLPGRCGYLSARSVGGVACRGCTAAEVFPPRKQYSLRTADAVERRTSLRDIKRQVTAAESSSSAQEPGWLILNFHGICDGCNKYSVRPQVLAALLDWLTHRPSTTAVRAVGAVMLHGFR